MSHFIVIFSCLFAGFLLKRKHQAFPQNAAKSLNSFVIYVSLPGVILHQIPPLLLSLKIDSTLFIPVSLAWFTFILSYVIFSFIGKKLNWSPAKTGALILTAGLGNTSFVGFPLLEALIGPQAIPIGILIDQPGSFLTLSTLGLVVAAMFSGTQLNTNYILKRVFTFPPFLFLVLAVVWSLFHAPGYEVLAPAFSKIGATLVPLALFAVGLQLEVKTHILRRRWMPLVLGLGFKLILAPLLFALLYMKLWTGDDLTTQVTVLESAMAPMITSAIVATEFNLDTEIANLMVGIGIPLSLITVPLINYFLF